MLGMDFKEQSTFIAFVLCRRAALFYHFCLSQNLTEEQYYDWDDLLSSEKLSQLFKVSLPESVDKELQHFKFKYNLPKSFLDFTAEPYNINIASYDPQYIILNEEGPTFYKQEEVFTHLGNKNMKYAFLLIV